MQVFLKTDEPAPQQLFSHAVVIAMTVESRSQKYMRTDLLACRIIIVQLEPILRISEDKHG
jgi:hypothetical protein